MCKYCEGFTEKYQFTNKKVAEVTHESSHEHFAISENSELCFASREDYGESVQIRFCPFCGRELAKGK